MHKPLPMLLIRVIVSLVFLLEGTLKFVFPAGGPITAGGFYKMCVRGKHSAERWDAQVGWCALFTHSLCRGLLWMGLSLTPTASSSHAATESRSETASPSPSESPTSRVP